MHLSDMHSFADLSRVKCAMFIGAHSDDVEIGAGGLLMRLVKESPGIHIVYVVLSGDATRHEEATAAANAFAQGAGKLDLRLASFTDRFFPSQHTDIKKYFDQLKLDFRPQLVVCHKSADAHQDHRVVNELAYNTFRAHAIMEYEIPKWDGDLATPNCYVPLSDELATRKAELLMEHFGSQRSKHWFDLETFRGLMRIRGIECNAKYAEGFHVRKMVV
jgi:LmbE family N-acetylglucosaminyl deacetylase